MAPLHRQAAVAVVLIAQMMSAAAVEDWTMADLTAATEIGDASKCYYAIFDEECGSNGGVYQITANWYANHYGGTFSAPKTGWFGCGSVIENWFARFGSHKSAAGTALADGTDLGTSGDRAIYQGTFNCSSWTPPKPAPTPAPTPAPATEPPQEKTFDVAEDCHVNSTVYTVLAPTKVTGVTFCSRYVEADKEYEYLMLIDKSLQWGVVGFNEAKGQMVGTEVMWLGMENASPTLKYKKNTAYSQPNDTPEQPDAPELEKIAAGIQARWRRPLEQGGLLTLTDDTSNLFIVLASKSGTPGGFGQHDSTEALTAINLSVPGASTGKDVAILKATNAKLAHGALMILAWGCFSPIATMFMKFGKHLESAYWFKGHKYLQFASIVTTIVAAIIIFTSDVEFKLLAGKSKEHAICGLVVLALCIVQGLLGYFRGKISKHVPADGASKEGYTHGPNRYIFNMLHRTTGWTLFGLALYTIFMGVTLFEEYNTDDVPNAWLQEPAKELFMAYCFVAAGLIVVLELLHVTKYKWSSGGPFSCSGSTQVTDTFKAEDDFEKKVRTIALSLFASFSIAVSITLWVIIAGTEKIKVENHDHGNHTH